MVCSRTLAILLAAWASALFPVSSAEIHVSPAGDDAAAGAAATPRRTLQAAVAAAGPGDIVVVHEGAYRECLSVEVAGTVTSPIRIQAAAGEEVVLDGAGLAGPAIDLGRSDHIIVEGLLIRGYADGGISIGVGAPAYDDSRLRTDKTPALPDAGVAEDVSVVGCRFEGCATFGVRLQATRRCVVRECAVASLAGEAAVDLARLADHSLVTENTISGVEPGTGDGAGHGIALRGGSSFNVVSENSVSGCAGWAIAVGADCWKNVIGRNTARRNQGGGYRSSGAVNPAFVWNVAAGNMGPGLALDGEQGRPSLGPSAIGNVCVANAGGGILVAGAVAASIQENISSGNEGAQIRFTPGAVIRGHHGFDYNCLYTPVRRGTPIAWGTSEPDLSVAQLVREIGIGAGNIAEDPGFTDATEDWTLPEASPCVAAGPGGENLGVNPVTPLADDVPAPDDIALPDTSDPTDLVRRCLMVAEGPVSAMAARITGEAASRGSEVLDIVTLRPDLVRLATPGEGSPLTRWLAIRALAALEETSIDFHLRSATGPFESIEALLAAGILTAHGGNAATTIDRASNSADPWVYVVALGTRAGWDAAAGDDLVLAADDGPPHVRLYAGARLMELRHPDAEFVWQSLRTEVEASPELQDAARAMVESGLVGHAVFADLLPPVDGNGDLGSPSGYARAAALARIARGAAPDEAVIRDAMAHDPSAVVRLAALQALLDMEPNQAH